VSTARGSIIDSAGQVLYRRSAPRPENARAGAFPPPTVWVPIALLAFVARLLPTLHGGGLRGIDDYDEGVYFSAAQALIAGRFPYRDFVLLHPPGIVLVLTPFAALARVVSDHRAFELARLAFMALGSINAVLTAAIARRARSRGVVAAAVAGVLYAVWPPAIDAESTTLLTPWSTLGMLLALLLLYRRSARPHEEFLAGVALGAAAAVKIWGVVPLVVVLAWELIRGRGGGTARVACGAAAGVTAVCLPFFLAAPGPMFRMVVVDQLERGEANAGVRGRISGILGVARFGSGARPPHLLVVAAVAVLCALVVVGAVLDRAWLVSALLVAIVTMLLTAPSFFAHYAGYAAAPLLVLTGTGAAALAVRPVRLRSLAPGSRHALIVALAVAAIPIAAFACVVAGLQRGTRFPGASLGKAAASSHCVTADSPAALIQMDLLSRDLERQCRLWIDVTGLTYDTAGARRLNGEPLPRRLNRPWQRALMDYLLSGNAIVLIRSGADGFAPENARTIDHLPVLARVAGHTLWQVPPGLQRHGGPLPPGNT
jgi:alpha-1,2-mannosyltransferase